MQTPKKFETEPKELARQARLLMATVKALQSLLGEVTAGELMLSRSAIEQAIDDMIKSVVTCPTLKIAVFAENEEERK